MRWLLLLLCGCETEEIRAWKDRRVTLEATRDSLVRIEAEGKGTSVEAFRRQLDLAGYVREHALSARVFVDPAGVRLTVSGTVQQCRDTVGALAELRWLTESWRLRLDGDHCEWNAGTGADFAALESALVAPPVRWTPPPPQWASGDLEELRATVARLEVEVADRESRVGLAKRLGALQPLVDSLRASPAPCDVAALDRELALDQRGQLLEVESNKLVHPLDPRGDFRLRGFVEVIDGRLVWHCEDRHP